MRSITIAVGKAVSQRSRPVLRAFAVLRSSHTIEIFNYFDAPYTNAFVEGLNSVIRAIAQQGRSYDFEMLRGKVLLGAGRKKVYPKTNFGTMSYMTFDRFMTRDFGVPFANIITKIDAGLLSSGEPKQP